MLWSILQHYDCKTDITLRKVYLKRSGFSYISSKEHVSTYVLQAVVFCCLLHTVQLGSDVSTVGEHGHSSTLGQGYVGRNTQSANNIPLVRLCYLRHIMGWLCSRRVTWADEISFWESTVVWKLSRHGTITRGWATVASLRLWFPKKKRVPKYLGKLNYD